MIIIDRLKGAFAACEIDGKIEWLERKLLPKEAKEGDVLVMGEKGLLVDHAATEQISKQAAKLLEKITEE